MSMIDKSMIQKIGNNAVRQAQRKSLENKIPNRYIQKEQSDK
jgi:hypothetical protein